MLKFFKKYAFPVVIFSLLAVLLPLIYFADSYSLLSKEQNLRLFDWALCFYLLMALGVVGSNFWKYKKELLTLKGWVGLSFLLLIIFAFTKNFSYFLTGLFVSFSFLFLLVNKKWYKPYWVFYFFVAFVLLRMLRSYNTTPFYLNWDRLVTFIAIPLAFSCFKFSRQTWHKILLVFTRMVMVYLLVTIVVWWYHILQADINPIEWLTTKKIHSQGQPVFYWPSAWSRFIHPSYNAIYIVAGFIGAVYLFRKDKRGSGINVLEVIMIGVASLFTMMIFESRVGFVIILSIFFFSYIYFLWNKKKILIGNVFLIAVLSVFLIANYSKTVKNFMDDEVRTVNYTLGYNYIKAHPWWGAGYYKQKETLANEAAHTDLTEWEQTLVRNYIHNQFMGDMLQFGVLGVFVLLALLFALFWAGIKLKSYILLTFTFTLFVYMLIEEPFYVQYGITRFVLFLSFFMELSLVDSKHGNRELVVIGKKSK